MSDQKLGSSFRDPSGFVFRRDGILYRQVNHTYAQHYDRLIESGLYDHLVGEGLLIEHDEVDVPPADASCAYKVIRPREIPFVSYPYEWCFSAYKDAAEVTLRLHEEALAHGMVLKDASAYNVQFQHARPVFVDTLSFEPYMEGQPWVAYQQFCKHFLAPLALMARRDIRFGRLLEVFIDGIPLDLASKLLPRGSYLRPGLLMHVHLHAKSQQRHAETNPDGGGNASQTRKAPRVSRAGALGILENLRGTIRKLDWKPIKTEWGAYYEATNYTDEAMRAKEALVEKYLDQMRPGTVWDLGANTGRFSRLASDRGIPTVAFDIDPVAVETNFRTCRANYEENLLPLLLDLTNPSAAIGWQNEERDSLAQRGPADGAFALALIHHLAISNNVPLPMIAEFFARICHSLVIEFVPKSDSQVRRLLSTREDVFPNYDEDHFRAAFEEHFDIVEARAITGSERTVFLMKNRT